MKQLKQLRNHDEIQKTAPKNQPSNNLIISYPEMFSKKEKLEGNKKPKWLMSVK